jgi:hypothetical protein
MGNPPFMPPKFASGPPTAEKNVWEDGPGAFVNPPNSATPVRYNGQDQVTKINTAQPMPNWEDGPGFADPGYSNVKVQGPQNPNYAGNPTLGVGTKVPVTPQGSPGQLRFYLGPDGNLYVLDNSGKAFVINPSATVPQPPLYAPTN